MIIKKPTADVRSALQFYYVILSGLLSFEKVYMFVCILS